MNVCGRAKRDRQTKTDLNKQDGICTHVCMFVRSASVFKNYPALGHTQHNLPSSAGVRGTGRHGNTG